MSILTLYHTALRLLFKNAGERMRERAPAAPAAEEGAGRTAGDVLSPVEETAKAHEVAALVLNPLLIAAMRERKWGKYWGEQPGAGSAASAAEGAAAGGGILLAVGA